VAQKNHSRGYLSSTLGCRCPRCREGKLFMNRTSIGFKKNMEMNKNCLVCGQPTEIEVGFYYGTSYVSYVLAVGISVASFLVWFLTIGMSLDDNRFFFWIGFNGVLLITLQPWLMRVSRSLWISWFVKHDSDWKEHQPEDVSERLNPDQANNW
jgi:uncharacterized protein (DUF983 family)